MDGQVCQKGFCQSNKCPSVNDQYHNAKLEVPDFSIESRLGANLGIGKKGTLKCLDGYVSIDDCGLCHKEVEVTCSKKSLEYPVAMTRVDWTVTDSIENGECMAGCFDDRDCPRGDVCSDCQCKSKFCKDTQAGNHTGNINAYVDSTIGSRGVFTCEGNVKYK